MLLIERAHRAELCGMSLAGIASIRFLVADPPNDITMTLDHRSAT
jgi:hypothetical protein